MVEFIRNKTDSLIQENKKFLEFTAYNKIFVIISAGVCIGLASKDAITSVMTIVLLPFFEFLSKITIGRIFSNKLSLASSHPYIAAVLTAIGNLFFIFSTWMIILYLTYIVFEKLIHIDLFGKELNIVKKIVGSNTVEENKGTTGSTS